MIDEKIRKESKSFREQVYLQSSHDENLFTELEQKALTAIKKIFFAEIVERLPKKKDEYLYKHKGFINQEVHQPNLEGIGFNNYREETIKLLKEICGVEG